VALLSVVKVHFSGRFRHFGLHLHKSYARGCISPLGQKEDNYYTNAFLLIDFWRRGFAPPPKINFILRPVGALEIVAPDLERTPIETEIATYQKLC
ncbi:MAG: hypothetical protein JW892_05125, partial [Anaerolineae bacterium]|nr:hypothetical protein [Anaerolineae bacterium]